MRTVNVPKIKTSATGAILALAFAFMGSPTYAATPPDACFTFDGGTGTITNYEAPGGANNCPSDVDIPTTIDVAGVPTAVTAIGNSAFYNKNLTSVTLPNTVTTIGDSAFSNNQLTSITIPDTVTSIGSSAFEENKLITANWPSGITTISNSVFYRNQLASFTIPSTVTVIGESAFGKNQLTSISFPPNLTTISSQAFAQNKVKTVTIPSSVTSIESMAFVVQSPYSNNLPSNPTPEEFSQIVATFWYVQVYTVDPANPNNLQSFAFVQDEALIDQDSNGDGDKIDKYPLGGHIINPASVTVAYRNTAGATVAPSQTLVGQLADGTTIPDFLAKNGPVDIPMFDGQTSTEQSIVTAKKDVYFTRGATHTFTAPTIAGYALQSPTSPHTMTFANQDNELTFVYKATNAPNAPNAGGINVSVVGKVFVYAMAVVIAIATLFGVVQVLRKTRR